MITTKQTTGTRAAPEARTIRDADGTIRALVQTDALQALSTLVAQADALGLRPRVWSGDDLRLVPVYETDGVYGGGLAATRRYGIEVVAAEVARG